MNNVFHENKQKPGKFLDTLSLKRTKSNWKCYKRTYLLTPLPNINFPGVALGNILYLFLSAWRSSQEDIKHLQNNLSPSRSQGIIQRPAIYDKASLRKDICKRFTENLHEFQVVTRSKQTKKYLEFWEVRKWFLLTCTRVEDCDCKQLFKELNKGLKCE